MWVVVDIVIDLVSFALLAKLTSLCRSSEGTTGILDKWQPLFHLLKIKQMLFPQVDEELPLHCVLAALSL